MSAQKGQVAVITGGASGIGAAIGKQLARHGIEVVLADRQLDLAEQVAAGIAAEGGRARAAELDVTDHAAFKRLADDIIGRAGHIDLLFNNAGIGVGGETHEYSVRDWDDVLDVNVRGVVYGIQAVYPHMVARRSGHIVNTASMAGLVPAAGEASYTASKHAVVGVTRSLRIEARRHGVRASVLCPGAIRTPILTGGKFGRINFPGIDEQKILDIWARVRPMDVDDFAAKVVASVFRNEAIIVYPRWWKALWYLDRLSPALSMKLWELTLTRLHAELIRLRDEAPDASRKDEPEADLVRERV